MILRRTVKVFYDIWFIIGISLLTLMSLEVVARISFAIQDIGQKRNKSQLIGIQPVADVYRNQNWVKDYFREFDESKTVEWRSYVYWRRKAYYGKYINIDDKGIRQTWNKSSSPSTKQVKIFMLGGSTLWGTGARDEFTIPSLVSKKLQNKWGKEVWVTNFGETGYVSAQELITLILELREGNIPDLVVFYDGINDTFAALQNGVAGLPQNESNRVADFNCHLIQHQLNWRRGFMEKLALYRFAKWFVKSHPFFTYLSYSPRFTSAVVEYSPHLASDVVESYFSNMRIVESLAQMFGFSAVFFWQPTIYNKKSLSIWEKRNLNQYGADFFHQVYEAVKKKAISDRKHNFHILSEAFEDEPRTVFIDAYHISEAGNDKISDLMAQILLQVIDTDKPKIGRDIAFPRTDR